MHRQAWCYVTLLGQGGFFATVFIAMLDRPESVAWVGLLSAVVMLVGFRCVQVIDLDEFRVADAARRDRAFSARNPCPYSWGDEKPPASPAPPPRK